MAFTPLIPIGGLTGWRILQGSMGRQRELFDLSPDIKRDVSHFKSAMAEIKNIDGLMGDRGALRVALGAFGLGDDIDKGAYVRKILAEGTTDSAAFAVRLNNADYLDLAGAINVGPDGEINLSSRVIDDLAARYQRQAFEIEVGELDQDMRLALNFTRAVPEILNENLSEAGGWYRMMGSVPLRTVLEAAFNLPSQFSQFDIDKQKDILIDKSQTVLGSKFIDVFQDPDKMDNLIRRFLLQRQIDSGPSQTNAVSAALSILSGGLGSGGIENLLLSNN